MTRLRSQEILRKSDDACNLEPESDVNYRVAAINKFKIN